MIRIKIALALTYILFAILLNSVGTVILQSILYFGVDKPQAAILEAFKDLSIAGASFLLAAYLPRFGYRNGMIVGALAVAAACISMPLLDAFWATKLLFASVGVSFGVVKVGVYSSIGLLTKDAKGHASLLNLIEGLFMVGVLSGYWLFAAFIDADDPHSARWLQVYWVLAGLALAIAALLATSRLDESAAHAERQSANLADDFAGMLKLALNPVILVFIACVFIYVLIEQGVGTWLPTFNKEILGLSSQMSVQAASIFAVGIAAGRLSAGLILRRVHWHVFLSGCLIAMAALVILTLPLAAGRSEIVVTKWSEAPLAAFLFPLIGLCMAPIYPAINSVILSALPKPSHAAMTGLIVVFSALGGTTGSLLTAFAFSELGGEVAFYLTLVPIAALFLLLIVLRRGTQAQAAATAAAQEA